MGHLTVRTYRTLYRRMNQFPPGVFDSETFHKILSLLFTEEEAKLCSVMSLVPSSVKDIAKLWQKPELETETILNTLADKGLLYDHAFDGISMFSLAPPVFGFFEFSLMRTDGRFDVKVLSELYHQYVNLDDGFAKTYSALEPPISRTYAQEDSIDDTTSEILSYETASGIVDNAAYISVGRCYCRHKMEHLGKACGATQDACLSFDKTAESLVKHGIARHISREEAHGILDICIRQGLAQIGDNVKSKPSVICNCCGCCCDLLLTYRRFGVTSLISPSNYIANIDQATCTQCGACMQRCPAGGLAMVSGKYFVNKRVCLGCGVCTRGCEAGACTMEKRPRGVFVPDTLFERMALAAVFQGKLGNFLFDDQRSFTHAVLRKLFNAMITLPGIRQVLMNKKINSGLLKTVLKLKRISNDKGHGGNRSSENQQGRRQPKHIREG